MVDNKEKEIQFQMRISSINVLRFSQYDIGEFDTNKIDVIEYQSDFNVKVLEESSELAVETTVKLKVQELDSYFGELKVLMKFHITPFETVIKKERSGFQVPDALMLNLLNIVAGTIRGILHEKLRGTILQNEIFPLIDTRDFMKAKEVK
ncbi:hypothetical protein [Flavobacterium ammonificans]|jgi:hypothetical protein|uniref:hypothetical protein n=1 Tax=Flavobacterium ammonificans TaxID=1751056 RepID=UPI001E52CBBC|nr:hypothetical protein [Flavobacterium ammonificans]BDB57683.1 hypothetical protein SHINM13_19790 [Flavobacterium ammonificans]